MDDRSFDHLTRTLAHGPTRRQLLKALVGGTMGGLTTLIGGGVVGADPNCRDVGHPCEGNQTCCSGLICTDSGPGAVSRCTACPPGTIACANNMCTACCVDSDCPSPTCSTGACTGDTCTYTPITCQASDACHVAGTCDPVAGACSNPAATDGTACTGSNLCYQKYACLQGTCTGTDPVICSLGEICNIIACDPTSGLCVATPDPDGTTCTLTDGTAGVCETGQCVQCASASDCAPPTNPCQQATCTNNQCGVTNVADSTSCTTAGGAAGTCQSGICVLTCSGNTPMLCVGDNGHQSCCFQSGFLREGVRRLLPVRGFQFVPPAGPRDPDHVLPPQLDLHQRDVQQLTRVARTLASRRRTALTRPFGPPSPSVGRCSSPNLGGG